MSRTRNFPQQPAPARGGTLQRNIYNNRPMPGEVNETGLPIGTPRPTPAPRPFAQNLTSFQAGGGTPALDAMKARNFPAAPMPAPAGSPVDAAPRFTMPAGTTPVQAAMAGSAIGGGGVTSAPAPAPSTRRFPQPAVMPALPTHPDDRALLMETRARDAAARAPEAPRPIPAGDPAARAWNLARGTGHPSTPEPGAVAPVDPGADPRILASAGTGKVFKTPWGTVRSTLATPGSAQTPALWSNTGVVHPPARVPEAATASPMSVPGYYPPKPLAVSAAPPQAAPPPRFPAPLAATAAPPQAGAPAPARQFSASTRPEASYASPPQAPALPPGMPSRTSMLTGPAPAPMLRPSDSPSRASLLTGSFPRQRKPAQALLENQDQ